MKRFFGLFAILALLLCNSLRPAWSADFRRDVIYQIVTDRFCDGDRANNNPPQSKGMFDAQHKNWQAYWGGDLKGITARIPYLKKLGIGAVWISPPVDNCNVVIPAASDGAPTGPYHGYHARDMMHIEEHFGDSANSWRDFDRLVQQLHKNHIKLVVDFACNHTNQQGVGEQGNLYDGNELLAAVSNQEWFHHNGTIKDFDNWYQLQYYELSNLADLAQENAPADQYIKRALINLQNHGVDGFRLDAIKHANWGWQSSLMDSLLQGKDTFVFGEWIESGIGNVGWKEALKLGDTAQISLLDFPVFGAMREVFANDAGFQTLDNAIYYGDQMSRFPTQIVTFFDNHDVPRLLNLNQSKDRLHQALVFLLTCRGIPCITYGTEHYLRDDTNGGADPYNRFMMDNFSTSSTACKLIESLSKLRATNPALAYGTTKRRWANTDTFVIEREFKGNVVTVAFNKNSHISFNIPEKETSLPVGKYKDYLHSRLEGVEATVHQNKNGRVLEKFVVPPASVSVWTKEQKITEPLLLSVSPRNVHSGSTVHIDCMNMGKHAGTLNVGLDSAEILTWSPNHIVAKLATVAEGDKVLSAKTAQQNPSNQLQLTGHSGVLLPVTIHLTNLPEGSDKDQFYVSGNSVEFAQKNGSLTALGPMIFDTRNSRLITVSLPASRSVQLKFIRAKEHEIPDPEQGSAHELPVPISGVSHLTYSWNRPHPDEQK